MSELRDLPAQYITDESGDKTAVILSMEQFEELIEDIEDLGAAAERRDDATVSHEELVAELKQDGTI